MSASNIPIDAGSQPKKPTSQRKIEANRRNARQSTGPTTARGKKIVSQNALKHGLLAREVVIRRGDGQEDGGEFQELLERLWAHYRPADIMEEMLVEKISISWWRLARVQRAETGEIRKKMDSIGLDHYVATTSEFAVNLYRLDAAREGCLYRDTNEADKKISSEERHLSLQRIESVFRKNPRGVAYLCQLLTEVRREFIETGGLSEPVRHVFIRTFGELDYAFSTACLILIENEGQDRIQGLRQVENQAGEASSAALMLIDAKLKILERLRELALRKEDLEEETERQSLCLPSMEVTDKLLRYETHLERQLYRAVDQLERIQRRRNGDSVPPPVTVHFARRT